MNSERELHVVFGSGAVGKGVAQELVERGKRVRMVNRSGSANGVTGAEVVVGDASDATSTRRVCQDASVVYNCTNAPYTDWPALFPPLQAGIIEGAAAAQAKLVVAENLYMYGSVAGPLREDLPYNAHTRKGRVRAEMAEALMEAHRKGIVRATSGRASDFYGPDTASQGVFGGRILYPLLAGKKVSTIGDPDMLHSYTYIQDFAKGLVILGERDEALGQAWHIPNAPALTTRQVLTLFFEEAGLPVQMASVPDLALKTIGFINPLVREVAEMLYEFNEPFVVDSSKFVNTFGDIATPLPEAVRDTLAWFHNHSKVKAAA